MAASQSLIAAIQRFTNETFGLSAILLYRSVLQDTICLQMWHLFCVVDRFHSTLVSPGAVFWVKYEQSFDIYILGRINTTTCAGSCLPTSATTSNWVAPLNLWYFLFSSQMDVEK